MTFHLSSHGAVFSTRPLGAQLREEALAAGAGSADLTISFAGVRSISYSFADEFLGPMISDDRTGRAHLTDVPPELHRVILGALERRGTKIAADDLFGVPA
jgi:hypothetical protein